MNIVNHGVREVVIDDKLHSFEVDAPCHHVSADQSPNISLRKFLQSLFPLLGCLILTIINKKRTVLHESTQLSVGYEILWLSIRISIILLGSLIERKSGLEV
jgi:hypothetical protein